MSIRTKRSFIKQLDKYLKNDKLKLDTFLTNSFSGIAKTEDLVIIDNYDFSGLDLTDLDFEGFNFINCKFDNCSYIRHITFTTCIFNNCTFNNSTFNDIKFLECDLISSIFHNSRLSYFIYGDSLLKNTSFESCPEILELYFGGCIIENLSFNEVYLSHSRFVGYESEKCENSISFLNSILNNNQFLQFDLTKSIFRKCIIGQTTFSNCILNKITIDNTNTAKGEFSFIDFQTIIKSESLEPITLENCFGITESIIKEKITEVAKRIEYQTLFISYSFKDKIFANRLNDSLTKKGISTFLWEKDAPVGKGLKKIMKEGVKKQDRLLFIASVNSIKSKACHFELTEGRKKQELLWQEILFPLHIDNYIFDVNKYDIRPLESQQEYWSNILELREISSIDFSNVMETSDEFEKKVMELIKGLKK